MQTGDTTAKLTWGRLPPWAYRWVVGLSIYMLIIVFGLPGTWRSAFWPKHSDWLDSLDLLRTMPAARNSLNKFKGRKLIVLLHHLPAGFWVGTLPFQLSSTFRARVPLLHRRLGYLAAVCTITLCCGVFVLEGTRLAADLGWAGPLQVIDAAWCTISLAVAVASARSGKYALHRTWMLRHVAAGIWVAPQRLVMMTIEALSKLKLVPGLPDFAEASDQLRNEYFAFTVYSGIAISLGACEYLLWTERSRPVKTKKQ